MHDRAAADALASKALETFGTVDILVNNAGVNKPQPIDEIDDDTWDWCVEINLTSIHAPDPRPRSEDEGSEVGARHSHFLRSWVSGRSLLGMPTLRQSHLCSVSQKQVPWISGRMASP
jgi:NAD(P)-dependent dehydrogenase (short-subunit alcohol dehydrogenase family)